MNAKELFEFAKARNEMCDSLKCSDCCLYTKVCTFRGISSSEEAQALIDAVEAWKSKHKSPKVALAYTIELRDFADKSASEAELFEDGLRLSEKIKQATDFDHVKFIQAQRVIISNE